MKIYIVQNNHAENSDLIYVFGSKKRAQKFMKENSEEKDLDGTEEWHLSEDELM